MNDDLKKNFEDLLKKGEYAEADKLLVAYMKESPKDLDAKMLYGTCRMMQGDSSTAKQIHDEVENQISESNDISETQKTFWQKYKKLIIYGAIGTALVYGGYKVYEDEITQFFGVSASTNDPVSTSTYDPDDPRLSIRDLYAGPEYYHKKRVNLQNGKNNDLRDDENNTSSVLSRGEMEEK